jgi:hypothetical protein
LEDYPQIPIEQKQVLKAQIQAVEQRRQQEAYAQTSLAEPSSRPSRRMAGAVRGMKGKLDQLKRKSEIRMPPSG